MPDLLLLAQPGLLEYESNLSFLFVFFLWFSFSFTKDSLVKNSWAKTTKTAFENMMEVMDAASFM